MKGAFIWNRIPVKYPVSMKIPLFFFAVLLGILPIFVQGIAMRRSFQQTQIDGRVIEVQNQCLITSDRLARAGYLSADTRDALLDKELDTIADIFNGRIVIVDQNFRIIKDTFKLLEGRFHVSESVLKCFRGENSTVYENEKHYFALTTPIYSNDQEKGVQGVLLMTVSTENILSNVDRVEEKSSFFVMITSIIIILVVAAFLKAFRDSRTVQDVFYGLRPASMGLIAASGLSVVLMAFYLPAGADLLHQIHLPGVALAAVLLILTRYCKQTKGLHPILFILASAVVGAIFSF